MSDITWLEGLIAVEAAFRGKSRDIHAIYAAAGKRGKRSWRRQRFLQAAREAGIAVERVDEAFIAERAEGKSHGGIIAEVGSRRFMALDALVEGVKRPFIVMLDGIEDPFNFGQAVRTLYAAGADGLVVRPRNWLTAAGVVARASAGASELMPMAVAETALDAAGFYEGHGLKVACTAVEQSQSIYEAKLDMPLFLLIGGEKRGITRSFLEQAELRLQIPYGRPFNRSLGAAASAAILGFEIMRQRQQGSTV